MPPATAMLPLNYRPMENRMMLCAAIFTLTFSSHGDTKTRRFLLRKPLKNSVSPCLCGQLFSKMRIAMLRISFICIMVFTLIACGADDHTAIAFSPKRQAFYDFFNDIRSEVADLEGSYSRLEGFTEDTRNFLESREAQERYSIAGLYFEKGLDREQGAYNYEDRFEDDGCVILVIAYPPHEQSIWQTRLQNNERGKGKQVGQNYVFYQVFTAQPRDAGLENKINTIIEQQIERHAATIGKLLN